jgi:ligand-binding SRPBCC domain-containing protein
MSNVHSLKTVQKIPATIEEVWSFFSNPANLLAITPPFLNLKVTNEVFGKEAYPGQVITYTVKPVLGIPVSWMTEIKHVVPLQMFVDEQRKGPYKLWHHQHHFKTIEGGVEMTDIVHYRLPLGFLGEIANGVMVKKKLSEIFSFRFQKVIDLYGPWPGGQPMKLEFQ